MEVREEFLVLLLDRDNRVLGCQILSKDGMSRNVVDMKRLFSMALESLATSIIWWLFLRGTSTSNKFVKVIKTDTIYVNRPYQEIVIKEVIKPNKVNIYKTDTLIREKLIHDTLFLAMELNQNTAKIHIITPEGIPMIKQHQLPKFESLKLDHQGNLEMKPKRKSRKKLWRNLERIGIAIGGFYLGSKL